MSRRGGQQGQGGQGQRRAPGGDQPGQVPQVPKRKKRRGAIDEERPLEPVVPAGSRRERVLYVGCEGEKTEPDYLEYLNERFGRGDGSRTPFRIQPVFKKNGLLPEQTVEAVRAYAAEDEAWAIFDRDRHPRIEDTVEDAAASSVEVCLSHPSFDLWLLLHFQAFGGRQSGDNTNVVDKLRKAHPAYKRFDKNNDKSVQGPRRKALEGKEKDAVAHAKSLLAQCEYDACKASQAQYEPVDRLSPENPDHLPQSPRKWSARSGHALDCPILDRDPSTDVWRLLRSLEIVTD